MLSGGHFLSTDFRIGFLGFGLELGGFEEKVSTTRLGVFKEKVSTTRLGVKGF